MDFRPAGERMSICKRVEMLWLEGVLTELYNTVQAFALLCPNDLVYDKDVRHH